MRSTLALAPDVEHAVAEYQSSHKVGKSAAVNALIREHLVAPQRRPFVQSTSPGHARLPVENIGDVLTFLDEPT